MKQSNIGWVDFSGGNLNFVSGCTQVSEGCANCYARAIAERFKRDFDTVIWDEDKLHAAMASKYILTDLAIAHRYKRGYGSRPICFVCDTGDFFHPEVPSNFIGEALFYMSGRKDIDWMVLTKRPERLVELYKGNPPFAEYCNNIWIGVTAETQQRADERIPILLKSWAGPTFVSIEPMLEAIQLHDNNNSWLSCPRVDEEPEEDPKDADCCESYAVYGNHFRGIDWVIVGAESGPNRRPFEPSWARQLYLECKDAGIPFFGKQDSDTYPGRTLHIDGRMIHEWPRSRG